MTTLGSYHHDFPHLAKQSGFYVQLRKGKINWEEIENIDIDDIIENRNFQLLEQNLINVINCNPEKEFDLKVIDKNFVKLFRIAQLGLDYLSYCKAYLDKCVVILQEQLIAFQEECESLKHEKEIMKEGIRNKRTKKSQNYQCEKCDKVFISDTYLKFHDKRRHNISNKPSSNSPFRKCMDNCQQTEGEGKSTTSTQTFLFDDGPESLRRTLGIEDSVNKNTEHAVKIQNLEQEIEDLKERLKKAENVLTEKNDTFGSSDFPSPFPGPTCPNGMLLLLPSYQAQPGSDYKEIKPRILVSAPEILQYECVQTRTPLAPKTVENKLSSNESSQFNNELEKFIEKKVELPNAGINFNAAKVITEGFVEIKREAEEQLQWEKDNTDPIKEKTFKLNKPLPPPRKSKKVIPKLPDGSSTVDSRTVELSVPPKCNMQPESGAESFMDQSVLVTSTPRKNVLDASDESWENLGDLNEKKSVSNESLKSRKSGLVEDSSASFFNTIVKKNSPTFLTFGHSIRRSLTHLCNSVSSTGKDLMKKESADRNVKTAVINSLNYRLQQLGVDPEWSGIPKKTMKQKIKAIKHRRKLLTKENPKFPIIRRDAEETIFQRLKRNLGSKDKNVTKKFTKQISVSDNEPVTQNPALYIEREEVKPQSSVMYDTESESESKASDSESSSDQDVEQNMTQKAAELNSETDLKMTDCEKEFDITVFQIGRTLKKKTQKDDSVKVEEVLIHSGTEDEFSVENTFKTLKKFLSDRRRDEVAENDEGQNKSGNQNALNGTNEFQSTMQLTAQKKVWFMNNDVENTSCESQTDDDDLWSLKSDWEKNTA